MNKENIRKLEIIQERDAQHLVLLETHIAKLTDEMKIMFLGQAEMEAYDWDKLDRIKYAVGERDKMKAIRNGHDH